MANHAGYGQFGLIEELAESELRAQLETNLFGTFWVTQAALSQLRKQRSGHILQVSSIGGISAFAGIGAYHASKWALEGFPQALAQEVADFGVHVTLIEPGGFDTDWGGASAKHAKEMPEFAELRAKIKEQRKARIGKQEIPKAAERALLKVVDAKEPPLRVFFGAVPLGLAKADYAKRLAEWEKWPPVALEAQGD